MKRVRGWSEAQLRVREDVFDGLITKAVKMSLRPLALNLNQIIVAAPSVSTTDASLQPVVVATSSGTLTALWDGYVDNELQPFLAQTLLDSAAVVLAGMESALDGSIPKITDSYAQAYLASASNRLKGIGDLVWAEIQRELQEGLDDGEDMTQLATRVRKVSKVMPARASVIARTEVHAAAEQGSLAQVQLGGFTDDECSKRWLATDDVKTREMHRKADGQVVGITQPFDVWGEGLQFPGDPSGRAENVIQCRCTMEYLFTDDAGDDDLDGDLVTAAKDVDWNPLDHPKGPDGRFIKKGAAGYGIGKLKLKLGDEKPTIADINHELIKLHKKLNTAYHAGDDELAADIKAEIEDLVKYADDIDATVSPAPKKGLSAFGVTVDEINNMSNSVFVDWFDTTFGSFAHEGNLADWKKLSPSEQEALSEKAKKAYLKANLQTPYTVIFDWAEMIDADANYHAKTSAPKGGSLNNDFMNELIDQEALAKASQPKPKKSPIVAKPMKINTTVIYKTEYANGAVIAEKPGKPNYRLVYLAQGQGKFVLQHQNADSGQWKTVETFGKGAAYKNFKDQAGWTTPAMAQQETADKILSKYDKGNIKVQQLTEVTPDGKPLTSLPIQPSYLQYETTSEINEFFKNLTPEQWNAYTPSEKKSLSDVAFKEGDKGNNIPNQKINMIFAAQVAEGGESISEIVSGPMLNMPTVINMSSEKFSQWFNKTFLDDEEQGLATWKSLPKGAKKALTEKAVDAKNYGYGTPLAVITTSLEAGAPDVTDDPKIPYPDFEDMHIAATNSWFSNLTLEQYGNFEEWEQEGIWAEAKSADEEFGNPKPLEALQSLTGQFSMAGPKSTLPNFKEMTLKEKEAWFDQFTQDEYNKLTGDEIVHLVAQTAQLNATGSPGPFKKISTFVDNAGPQVLPDIVDSSLDDDIDFTPQSDVTFLAIEKMDVDQFKTYVQTLGPIDDPSDVYWDTAQKLGITPWAEFHVGQKSPYHVQGNNVDTPTPGTVTVKGTEVPVNTPVPDKLDVTGLSPQDAHQAMHVYAVAKTKPAESIGEPATYDASFKVLTKSSAKKLQDDMLAKAGKKWNSAEIAAVQQYTTKVGYQTSNAILRNDQARMKMFSTQQLTAGVQRAIDLQNAMTPLTESVVLHRGTGAQAFGFSTASVSTEELKKLEGKVIHDRGFGSTSVVAPKNITFDYANKPVKVIVKAPAGTPGVYVTSAYPAWDTENEFILAAGTNYRIDEVRAASAADKASYGNGVEQVVTVTVVPHKGTPTDEVLKQGDQVKTPAGTTVTPAPAPKAPPTAPIQVKPANTLVPIKLNTKTIHSTTYAPGAVVAVRYAPLKPGSGPPVTQRLFWNGKLKKFVLQVPTASGGWVNQQVLTKKDAYEAFKNDTNWYAPKVGENALLPGGELFTPSNVATKLGLPNVAPTVTSPAQVTSPKIAKTPVLTADEIINQYGNVPILPPEQEEQIWKSFKTTSGFGTMMLGKPSDVVFKALVHATVKWNENPPNGVKYNHLQILKLIDHHAATWSGTPNSNAYEKKIVDWLKSSAGQKQAPELVAVVEKALAQESKSAPKISLANLKNAYDIGTIDTSATSFPNITPSKAAAMHTAMRKQMPLTTQQITSIKYYTGSGSGPINGTLRSPSSAYSNSPSVQHALHIQDAMAPLPTSMTLHRGTHNLHGAADGIHTLEDLQKLVGKTFSDGSFFSTSVGEKAAFDDRTFQLQIEAPAGTPGVYVKTMSSSPHENELILAAGLNYEIMEVTKTKPGQKYGVRWNVRLRVVNPK